MAFGNAPNFTESFPLDNFSPQQFIVIALETIKKLDWYSDYIDQDGFIAYTRNGLYSWNGEIKVTIDGDYAVIKSSTAANSAADEDGNKKTVQKFIEKFNELKYSLSAEQLKQKYEELKPGFATEEEDTPEKPKKTFDEKVKDFFSLFKPRPGYYVTPILIDLNIAVWILMVATGVNPLLPNTEDLIKWGANFRPITLEGQWWRLLTCCFLHIGILHLLLNMYALVYIGLLLEPRLGRTRFTTAYLLTGIASSTTSLYWHDLTVSAGASGAIFGLYGVFLAMLTTNLIEKEIRFKLLRSIGIFIFYNLAYGMKGGIDNAAHIGGLVSGLIIGYAFYPSLIKPTENNLKHVTVASLAILIIASSFVVLTNTNSAVTTYDIRIREFSKMESKAMGYYKILLDANNDIKLSALDTGTYYWNSCITLIKEVDKLNLPEVLHKRDEKIITYCNLRLKSYTFIYKDISEKMQANYDNSSAYRDSIMFYNRQIEAVIKELKDKK